MPYRNLAHVQKNPCLSCADELSLYLHRCASSSACTDEGKVFKRIYIKNIFIICFSCQLSAKGSGHSIHHWDTICEIKSSFILSLELVPWQFIVKIMVQYSSCSSVFSSESTPLGHRAEAIQKIQVFQKEIYPLRACQKKKWWSSSKGPKVESP